MIERYHARFMIPPHWSSNNRVGFIPDVKTEMLFELSKSTMERMGDKFRMTISFTLGEVAYGFGNNETIELEATIEPLT